MSDIPTIDPIALDPTHLPGATIPPSAAPTGQPQTIGGNADQPAVVLDLSAAATTSLQTASTALALNPSHVDHALSCATGVNGFAATAARGKAADVAATAARSKEANVAAEFGTAHRRARNGRSDRRGRRQSIAGALLRLGPRDPDPGFRQPRRQSQSGASAATISVGAFSFTHGGSTYAVTPGADGSISGTRDGQPWRTWQLANPADTPGISTGASPALQTLASPAARQHASTGAPLAEIDVSA